MRVVPDWPLLKDFVVLEPYEKYPAILFGNGSIAFRGFRICTGGPFYVGSKGFVRKEVQRSNRLF